MAQHLAPSWWTNTAESTKRTARTALQYASAFAALILAVAIPPVGDAINAILGLLPFVNFAVTPPMITAVGLVGLALTAIITKLQNVVEGRDKIDTPEALAGFVVELTNQVNELSADLAAAVDAAQHSSGSDAPDLS